MGKDFLMYKRYLCFLLTFIFVCYSITAAQAPTINAEGAILIEPKTNTILYAKNIDQRFFPASTTKILTSLILLEDMPLNTTITKTKSSTLNVPSDSSQIGLSVGSGYSALEGLYAVLLASDNFVCYDMAVKDAGSQKAFADKMNAKAKSLGALSSHFITPHGYHNPNHYTTPFDLSQIAKAAFDNPKLLQIAGTKKHNFVTKNGSLSIPLNHTALLLDETNPLYNPNVIAAKTGFHTPAKRTLVAKAKYNNIDLVGIVMKTNAPHQFEDMNTLFKYGAQNYSLITSENGETCIDNHSYSPWAKYYIQFALKNNWIKDTSKNYTDVITKREFVNLLKSIATDDFKGLLDQYIDYNKDSIYKENLPVTRKDAALICYNLLYQLNPTSTYVPVTPTVPDINSLNQPYKNAVHLAVTSGILGKDDTAFKPNGNLTYEEALALLCRLNPILKAYTTSPDTSVSSTD